MEDKTPRIPPSGFESHQELADTLSEATGMKWVPSCIWAISADMAAPGGSRVSVCQMETVDRWEITHMVPGNFMPKRRYVEVREAIAPMVAELLSGDDCSCTSSTSERCPSCQPTATEPHPAQLEEVTCLQLLGHVNVLTALLPGNDYSNSVRISVGTLYGPEKPAEVWVTCRRLFREMKIYRGETFAQAIGAAHDGIVTALADMKDQTVRRMALTIIEATADHGGCSLQHLFAAGFNGPDVTSYGAAACERAALMAGGQTFSIAEG